jgi:hypothetical protein
MAFKECVLGMQVFTVSHNARDTSVSKLCVEF